MKKAVCHRNGTVTFWSVYGQMWVKQALNVPDGELAAMNEAERNKVLRHLRKHNFSKDKKCGWVTVVGDFYNQ